MKKREKARPRKKESSGVIRLEDLAPRKPVTGGAGGRLFGQREEPPVKERPASGKEEESHGRS